MLDLREINGHDDKKITHSVNLQSYKCNAFNVKNPVKCVCHW